MLEDQLSRRFFSSDDFKLDIELPEERHEIGVQRLTWISPVPQAEKKAQIYLVMVRIQAVLRQDMVVCGEDGAKRKLVNTSSVLGLLYNLEQDCDICTQISVTTMVTE